MDTPSANTPPPLEQTLLIVVGAHPQAEVSDRPLAAALREQIDTRSDCRVASMVLTDLWYLNAAELLQRPTIAIGHPEHNAASAMLSGRVPSALVIEGSYQVEVDVTFNRLQACLWGVDPLRTADAVEAFRVRYLDGFLHAAALVACGEPHEKPPPALDPPP